jgi:spermidine synthase
MMRVLARFNGRNGEISVIEELATGARLYHEAGVHQGYVLPGGDVGLTHVRVMTRLLSGYDEVLLLGCAGGALATALHRQCSLVTVVDNNPISFELARRFFWMPAGIRCIVGEMQEFLSRCAEPYDAIGVDIGRPCFFYEDALSTATCARMNRLLRDGGRIVVNIACDWEEDPTPDRIAGNLEAEDLDVWLCDEPAVAGRNTMVLASSQPENRRELRHHTLKDWDLRRPRDT